MQHSVIETQLYVGCDRYVAKKYVQIKVASYMCATKKFGIKMRPQNNYLRSYTTLTKYG